MYEKCGISTIFTYYINIILFYNLIVSICFLNNNNDKILTFLKLKINKLLYIIIFFIYLSKI